MAITGKELLENYKKKRQGNNVSSEETTKTNSSPITGSQLLEGYRRSRGLTTSTEESTTESAWDKYKEFANSKEGSQGWQKYLADQEASKQAVVEEKEDEKWWEKIGRWLGSGGAVDTSLPMGTTTQAIHSVRDTGLPDYTTPADDWNDEQRNIFGYLYSSNPDKASKYAEYLNTEFKEKEAIKKIQESATSNFGAGAAHTVGAIATAPLGLADFLNDLVLANAGVSNTQYDGVVSPFEYSQAVTGGISTHLNEEYGTIDESVPIIGGKGWGDVYGLGTSIAQSAVSGYTMGGAGTLVSYFGQGAASGVDDALSRGASEEQAITYGALVGLAEGIAESIGIEKLFKMGASPTKEVLIKNLIKQAGAEGLEEGLTSVMSNAIDNVVMGVWGGNKSNFDAMVSAYMAQGMTEDKAKLKAWMDSFEGILFDAAGGFVSGGVHGVAHTGVLSAIDNHKASKLYGNQSQQLIDDALSVKNNSELQSLAEKYKGRVDKGKNLKGSQINNLINATDTAKLKNAILQRLGELGETSDVTPIADVLVRQAMGEELSSKDTNILNNSKAGHTVLAEINKDNIKSGGLGNKWAENIGTRRISPESYNKGVYELAKMVADFKENASQASVSKELAESGGATEAKIEVSDNGKNMYYDAETDSYIDADIKRIVSTKGGIKVELGNGKTVSASDLRFATREEGVVYEMLARMEATPDTANEIIKTFKPSDAKQASLYYDSIPLAYRMGLMGNEQGLKYVKLTDAQKRILYNRGRIDAVTNAKERGSAIATSSTKTNAEASKSGKKGVIYEGDFVYDESTANDLQKAGMAGAEAIAKTTNLEVHIFESFMKDGKRVSYVNGKLVSAPNGYFTAGNKIYIDINAGMNAEGAMLYALAHEVTHYVRKWNPKGFKDLADFLISEYGKQGVDITGLIQRQKDKIKKRHIAEETERIKKQYEAEGKAIPSEAELEKMASETLPNEAKLFDTAYEELVADAMSDMLADPKAYEKLAKLKQKNFKVWKKLGEVIKQVLDKLKDALNIYRKDSPVAQEAFHVRNFSVEAYNKLQDLYIKAFVEADANYEASGGEETNSSSEDVKHSERDDEIDTGSTEYKIKTSMTMAEAKRMIETAYKVNNIAEYYEGEYKDAEDWLKKAGSDEVEMYIENDFDLQAKYVNSNEDILNEEYRISDVLDAYLAGTLIGKEKPKPKRLDVSQSTKLKDSRFYSPHKIEDAKATFEIAKQKAVGKDAESINRARAEILLFAHNKGAAELLGITQSELNKKLRSWSNYSATAKNISERINAGVAEENRWTGIENCSYINKAKVTNEDIERLVASVEGDSKGYERKYIARVMLAADTHIDYSGLKFKFASSQQVNADNNSGGNSGGRVLGFYDDTNRQIEVTHDKPNTVAHEMGHYIDAQWGRELVGSSSSHLFLTRGVNADIVKERYGEPGVQFLNNFKLFINSLSDVNQTYNSYYNDRGEIFARFFARFIEWTDNIATGNKYYSYESRMYGDKFTQAQFVEFARLLQEKALLDGNVTSSKNNTKFVKSEFSDTLYSDRDTAYMDAINRGDMETAQRMVDEAAEKAGYTIKAYHGTDDNFTVFDKKKIGSKTDYGWFGRGFYFHIDADTAKIYGKNNMGAYLKTEKLLDLNTETRDDEGFDDAMDRLMGIKHKDNESRSIDFTKWLVENGYDGVAAWGQRMVLNSNQIKSADPVTYDGNGNVIPLSERFNAENDDIRYSFRDSESGMANDALSAYDEELTRFIEQRGDYIVDSFDKLKQIVNLAFDNPNLKSTAYFGIINAETLEEIKNSIPNLPQASKDILFKKGKEYSIATTLDAIRHIVDDKNLSREDVIDYLDRLADTIVEFDSVSFDYYTDTFKQKNAGLLFKKKFLDGTLMSFNLISHKKRSVVLQSLYMEHADYQKKKSAKTLLMQNSLSRTPEVRAGQTSTNSISEDTEFVNRESTEKETMYSDRDSEGNVLSKEQQEFFKDSKIRGMAGTLLKVYHATDANFTVFDKAKIGSGNGGASFGLGFYFATYADLAGDYGDNMGEYYLNITNPFEYYTDNKEVVIDMLEKSGYEYDKEFVNSYDYDKLWDADLIDDFLGKALVNNNPYVVFSEMLQTAGYDGVWAGSEIVAFDSNQAKLTTNRNPTSDPDIRYSDRDTDSVSNRTLLANALESVAKNDIEKAKLAQYKDKIALIEAEQVKLNNIKAEANSLRFTKGRTAEETKKMRDLDFMATQTANRINTYDKQLLNLESTSALKNVLEREKTNLRKRLEQKGKEALQAQRAKNAETVREIMTRNTESRKKAVEGRHKTEMRHKIQKVVSDLNKLLLNPTKEQHIPIGLQKVVADALDAINMDTMNAEERVKYYNDLIAKSNNADDIKELTKKRDFFEYRDMNFKERITALKNAYAEFKESDDPLIRNAHNDAIADLIKNTADSVGKNSLKDMTYEQLEAVYDMYKAVLATVRNANKLFKEGRQETVTENSEAVKAEVKEVGGHQERVLKAVKFFKKFGWDMLKPVTALKVIGSKTLAKLFDNVRKAEDTWAVDVNEAKEFYKAVSDKYGYNKWDFKAQHSFKDSGGEEFSISLEQMLSLYAYSKREQADEHLDFGGFIFDDAIEVVEKNKLGIPLKYEVNDANPHRLGQIQIMEIIGKLTQEQRAFVDEMQTYLSDVMGAKGNEVSLALYDIKLYKEKNYFPLKTARYFREFDPEKSGTPKIKNSGFSKKTVPQAGNPIVLSNFMDVWAAHVNDMSMYHAFVLPLEDFMRVYNYSSTAGGYDSVQQYIKNAYGSQANQYIERLMDDLNGGARVDSSAGIINKGISLFKKASVFASASVVVQQPSAIARAFAYINPKYFATSAGSALNLKKHKEVWAEVKQYAPVAVIKEMGCFDTGMGRSTVEWIKGNQTIKDKMDDILSKAPAMADELSWSYIWLAVKKEIQATTNLTPGSEEFLKKAGERFTEIITNTQVYDSVLARSGMMRSKDTGMKMATAFMAEPTTAVNMMVDGIMQGKRGNKKFTASTVGAISASIILNSILVALVYAARDDDEDETYTEKYVGSLTSELVDGFNPLTYIPFVKDAWSIAQGYDVERSDMSVVSNLWESIEGLFNDNKSGWEKVSDATGAVASLFGMPLKNLIRDAKGMYNLTQTLTSGTPTTGAGISESIEDAFTSSIPLWDRLHDSDSNADRLYKAMISGNQAQISRIKSSYATEQAFESAKRQALRDNDPRIRKAAQARYEGDIAEYTRIAKEIIGEGHFSQDIVVGAINAELNAIKRGEAIEPESTEGNDEITSIYSGSDINAAFNNGDFTLAKEIILDLIETKVANGMEEKSAKSSLKSSMTSYWKPLYKQAYQSGDTSEMLRIRQILYASGLYGTANDVVKTVQSWARG